MELTPFSNQFMPEFMMNYHLLQQYWSMRQTSLSQKNYENLTFFNSFGVVQSSHIPESPEPQIKQGFTPFSVPATSESVSGASQQKEKQRNPAIKQNANRKQKSNRNVSSNILKHFLVYVKNRQLVTSVLERLTKAIGVDMAYQEFVDKVKFKFRKIHNYVRPTFFRELCFGVNCDLEFSQVLRILFCRFIKVEFCIKVQHSSKVGRAIKYEEIKGSRKLLNSVLFRDN